MCVLRVAPYELVYGTLVLAKVLAKNTYGEGPISDANTAGAKIQNVP